MKAIFSACQSIQFLEVVFRPCAKWKRAPTTSFCPFPGYPSSRFTTTASIERREMAARQALESAIVVYVTVPNEETGKKLSKSIVSNKLAACVNQIPGVESTYWWKGQVETDSELLLIIKTRQSLLEALTQHVKDNHPYDVPEVISLPITGGNEQYLKWLHDSTADHGNS